MGLKRKYMSTDANESKEWERTLKNPNNMIVSDVLKDLLPPELYEEPENKGTLKVRLVSKDLETAIIATLDSFHTSNDSWTITGKTTKKNALSLITNSDTSWLTVSLFEGQDEPLKEIIVNQDTFTAGVQFPEGLWNENAPNCSITMSCLTAKANT